MSMTVGELKEMLEGLDDEAEVRIMSQENWPFEYSIRSLKVREDFEQPDEDEVPNDEKNPNDVFLVEGSQLCYGNKDAFY